MHVFFATEYWVEDYCGANRTTAGAGVNWKDTNFFTSVRYGNYRTIGDSTFGFAFLCQSASGSNEISYSKVKGPLWFNMQFTAGTTEHHADRCTVYCEDTNFPQGIRTWAGAIGPFEAENCVVISVGNPQVTLGYPPKNDKWRRIVKPWLGYQIKTIVSEEWYNVPQNCFAIKVAI